MKTTFRNIMFMAAIALTYTACEDVPEPYDIPGTGVNIPGTGTEIEGATGSGTTADPYNVIAALNYTKQLSAGEESTEEISIKGKVVSISEIGGSYGNATYYISDDGTTSNQFYVYRSKNLGNTNFTSASDLAVGDDVVVIGYVTNFKGNTPETVANKSRLYSRNGQTAGESADDPNAYVSESFSADFGSFTLNTVKGQPWIIDFSTAKATGYVNSQNIESESYLISPAFDLSSSTGAVVEFEHILAYSSNAGENKVLITSTYNASTPTAGWTDITGTLEPAGTTSANKVDWNTFKTHAVNIPSEFIGKNNVRVALYYSATSSGSRTWEVRNFKVREGQANDQTSQPTSELGTLESPITVAKALETIAGYEAAAQSKTEAYVKGKIVSVVSYNSSYKSLTYYISDDGTATNQLQVYSGKGLGGADFSSENDLSAGQEVIVKGYLKAYVNKSTSEITPEINQNNQIVSLDGQTSGGGSNNGSGVTGTGTVVGNTLVVNAAEFGFTEDATTTTLVDGTVMTFSKASGVTTPKFYSGSNASLRVYANNTINIEATKNITKIDFTTTDPANGEIYNGSDNAYAEGGNVKVDIVKGSDTSASFSGLNSKTVLITNYNAANSKNQIRIKQMVITFAE